MSQLHDDRDDMLFLWFALLVLIFVVIPALYAAHKGSVNAPLVWLASIQLRVFAPFSEEVRTILERLTEVEPAALTWEQVRGLLRYAGAWMRWPLALLLLLCGSIVYAVDPFCYYRIPDRWKPVFFSERSQAAGLARNSGADTVLNLFGHPRGTVAGLTAWDLAYLQGLYSAESASAHRNLQEADMAWWMARRVRQGEAAEPN